MHTSTQEMQAATSPSSHQDFLVFSLGNEEYGVKLSNVQELRSYETVTSIANAPGFVKGVINLRGIIVPIIDLRVKLNLGSARYDAFTVVIILTMGDRVVGVVVDSVADVVTLAGDAIKPAPDFGANINADYLIGLGMLEERMVILVDTEKLMSFDTTESVEEIAA